MPPDQHCTPVLRTTDSMKQPSFLILAVPVQEEVNPRQRWLLSPSRSLLQRSQPPEDLIGTSQAFNSVFTPLLPRSCAGNTSTPLCVCVVQRGLSPTCLPQ